MNPEQPELAELTQALLDAPTLSALVHDLSELTQVLSLTVKGGAEVHGKASSWSLDEAVAALLAGHLRGVQIHYVWSEKEWIDTLLRRPEGVMLVRTQA